MYVIADCCTTYMVHHWIKSQLILYSMMKANITNPYCILLVYICPCTPRISAQGRGCKENKAWILFFKLCWTIKQVQLLSKQRLAIDTNTQKQPVYTTDCSEWDYFSSIQINYWPPFILLRLPTPIAKSLNHNFYWSKIVDGVKRFVLLSSYISKHDKVWSVGNNLSGSG